MASLESLRHVSLGQYLPTGSLLHRLDARLKLAASLVLMVMLFMARGYVVNMGLLMVVTGLVALAKLPLLYILTGLKPAIPFILVLSVMQLLFLGRGTAGTDLLLELGPLVVSWEGVQVVVVSLLRFGALLFIISLLTNTTTNSALTHGVEWWLRPLTMVGLPGHELALVMAIALRFLPVMGEELETISQAQASRSVSTSKINRFKFIAGARRTSNLIVPLFVSTLRRADELALAMQARCYQGGKGRTQLNKLSWKRADTFASLIIIMLFSVVVISRRIALP